MQNKKAVNKSVGTLGLKRSNLSHLIKIGQLRSDHRSGHLGPLDQNQWNQRVHVHDSTCTVPHWIRHNYKWVYTAAPLIFFPLFSFFFLSFVSSLLSIFFNFFLYFLLHREKKELHIYIKEKSDERGVYPLILIRIHLCSGRV